MELFGSLTSISGAFTASAFSGSFVGDASGLYNIQASGVTGLNLAQIANGSSTASISDNGLQVNTNTFITGGLTVLGTITAEQLDITVVSSSVLFQSGSTKFGDTLDDNHNITGSVNISGSISLNGQAIGTGKLDETTFYSYTSSNNGRVSSLETSTSSLNSFTNSINTTIKNKLNTESVISGSIQVDITNTTNYSSFSSSIATTDSNQESRLNAIEIMTNSLNNFSYSIDSTIKNKLNVENVISSSGQITLTSVNGYSTFSSSLATINLNQDNRLSALETTTGSLNTFTSSALTRVSAIETSTASLNTFTSSQNTFNTAHNTATASLNSFTSSINTTIDNRLNTKGVISGSSQILNNSSIVSSSAQVTAYGFATTGSNTFVGTENINGSLTVTGSIIVSSGSAVYNSSLNLTDTSSLTLNSGSSLYVYDTGIISGTFKGSISSSLGINGNVSITGSIVASGTSLVSGSSQIDITSTINYTTFSSSIATTDANQNTRLNAIETATASLNTLTASVSGRVNSLESSTASLNSYTSSNTTNINAIQTATASLNTFTSSANGRLNSLESASSSIRSDFNSYTSSNDSTNTTQNNRLTSIETSTGSLNTFTSSINTTIKNKLNSDGVISGSIQVDITSTTGYSSFSSSLATTDLNQDNRLTSIETSTSSLNSYTSSTNTRLNTIESTTSSLNTFTSSINTTIKNKLNSDGIISGSVQVSITETTGYSTFSSSLATTDLNQENRLNTLEGKTGSYATTGSNVFQGNQTITGSLYVSQDLIVAGSSSIQHISSSVLNILDNIITVNTLNPSVRFGGLGVIDSGSLPQVSGSLLFDSVENQWIFVHQSQASVTSSLLIMGPETYDNLGNETHPTTNRLMKSINDEHIGDSNITDTGTKISINSNTEVTGTLKVTGNITSPNITSIESTTASLNTYTSSNNTIIGTLQTTTASLNSYTSSNTININAIQTATSSLNSYTSSTNTRLGVIESSTASLNTYTSSNNTRLNGIETTTGSLNSYTSSNNSRLNTIESTTGSLNTFTSSANGRLNSLETASGSIRSDFNSYTSSANGRLTSIETSTGSINTFTSSASSRLTSIETSTGSLNSYTSSTNTRLNNIETSTGSLNSYTSSTNTRLNAIETSTGSLNTFTSSQNTFNTAYNTATASLNSFTSSTNTRLGLIETSTGSLNTFTNSINTTIDSRLNTKGVISGSSQVDFASISNKPTLVSGSSQITFSGISGLPTLVSGSSQITFSGLSGIPSGIVSGSSQITYSGISSIPSGIVSGSSQVTFSGLSGVPSGLVSGSSQVSFGSISGVPSGLVSGSSQVSYTALSNIPSGIVSGSAQLTSTFVQKAGDTVTGVIYSTYNTASGRANLGFSTAKTTLGNIHVQNGSGPGNDNSNQAAITFQGGVSSEAQAGIYVLNNGSYGTSMGFATTESYSTGPQLFMTATNGGVVNFPRARPTYAGNTILDAANYTSYAMQGAGYSANQNLNTTNSPTFVGLTLSGILNISGGASGGFTNGTINWVSGTGGGLKIDSPGTNLNIGTGWNENIILNTGAGLTVNTNNGSGTYTARFTVDRSGNSSIGGTLGVTGAITQNGNQVLHAGNFTSYAMSGAGYSANQNLNTTSSPTFDSPYFSGAVSHNTSSSRNKYNLYGGSGTYCIGMQSGIGYGGLSDWGMTFQFNNDNARGFWWGDDGHSVNQGAMALTTHGYLTLARGARIGYGESDTATPTLPLQVYGSGGTVVDIQGASGQLFSVTDDLTGDIFSVSDISGIPFINVNTTNGVSFGYTTFPSVNNAYDLGTSSLRWANVYTNDLHLSNEGKVGGNEIDGTTGDWTIQEGQENLYIINNKNGKKFKINLTEIE
jgi:hypothetical protein